MTFAKGAALSDPSRLFNASLEGTTRRAIDFREGDKIDEKALQALVRGAAGLTMGGSRDENRKAARVGFVRSVPNPRHRTLLSSAFGF